VKIAKLLLINLLLVFSSLSIAQGGISVTSTIIEHEISPGEHISDETIISIDSADNPENFSAEVMGMSMSLYGSKNVVPVDEDKYAFSAQPFLKITPAFFHLEPGESQNLLIEGDVPDDVTSGTWYALAEVMTNITEDEATKIGTISAIEIPILLTVSGSDLIRTGEIFDLQLDKPVSAQQQNLSLTFKNTGNTHFKVLAKADLLNENGDVLTSASAPLSSNSIIPEASYLFKLNIKTEEELMPGDYLINATVALEDESVLASKEVKFRI